ncbi:sensor histidine kinase [Paenibacillus sp. HWE-109]|uniref:sensor histidine kinase n=1 Tax=Paenibacillus sp. HWE-109 TaxID=1306526 RepID=UPI001EDE0B28|nr:sensor histidine kinase [Paenibacillus sp. HWE-109]UKS28318.1 sensor histidine kinase [Paenibacillus sp. HWE-109]
MPAFFGLVRLNNMKIHKKLLLIYIFCVFLPITLTNYLFYAKITQSVKKEEHRNIELSLERLDNQLTRSFKEAAALSNNIYFSRSFYEGLDTTYQDNLDYTLNYGSYFRTPLMGVTPYFQYHFTINFYTDNPSVLNAGSVLRITPAIRSSSWYSQSFNSSNSHRDMFYFGQEVTADGERLFSVIRNLNYYTSYAQYQKILKLDIRYNVLTDIFNSEGAMGKFFLVDDKNRVIYTSLPQQPYLAPFNSAFIPDKQFAMSKQLTPFDSMTGYRIIGVYEESVFHKALEQPKKYVLLIALANLLFATILISLISRSLYFRTRLLSRHMDKVDNQHFALIEYPHVGKDEIGLLFHSFNRMIRKVKQLINDVYEAELRQKSFELESRQAELMALQSQVNPHYLFNVLETIRMKSVIKGELETADMLSYMSKSYRRFLISNREWVTVEEELEMIQEFLSIQKYRFEDEIDCSLEVEKNTLPLYIPSMVFQPFVENAFKHGIQGLDEKGLVSIRVYEEKNYLVFYIEDNGIGIKPEKLDQLLEDVRAKEPQLNRIGMQNVFRRITLFFKDQFEFNINSKEHEFTSIELKIPLCRKNPSEGLDEK